VTNGGSITLEGGSTAQIPTSNGNGAYGRIRGEGNTQTINFAPGGTLTLTGGTNGARNRGEILTNNASQQIITGSPNVVITAGTSGGASATATSRGFAPTSPRRPSRLAACRCSAAPGASIIPRRSSADADHHRPR